MLTAEVSPSPVQEYSLSNLGTAKNSESIEPLKVQWILSFQSPLNHSTSTQFIQQATQLTHRTNQLTHQVSRKPRIHCCGVISSLSARTSVEHRRIAMPGRHGCSLWITGDAKFAWCFSSNDTCLTLGRVRPKAPVPSRHGSLAAHLAQPPAEVAAACRAPPAQ